MTDAPFRPFETLLDRDAALSVLRDATAGADDGELRQNDRSECALGERQRQRQLIASDPDNSRVYEVHGPASTHAPHLRTPPLIWFLNLESLHATPRRSTPLHSTPLRFNSLRVTRFT